MKKPLLAVLLFIGLAFTTKAQYVTIPDSAFAAWLTGHYPQCMSGNQLDTICSGAIGMTSISISHNINIHDLEGVQYFKNLDALQCDFDQLTTLPILNSKLRFLSCTGNNISYFPPLPDRLEILYCNDNPIYSIIFPNSLKELYISNVGSNNMIFNDSLEIIDCSNNNLHSLRIPYLTKSVDCSNNNITNLNIGGVLENISCSNNSLSTIDLSQCPNLSWMDCSNNQITYLSSLPSTVRDLYILNNPISSLPTLPNSMLLLSCSNTLLTYLPVLPPTLQTLLCSNDSLTYLPQLPQSLTDIDVSNNNLLYLPQLPNTIGTLDIHNNPSLKCLPHLGTISQFRWASTGITCLPNFPNITGSAVPSVSALPLCDPLNPNFCPGYVNINGRVLYDSTSNCILDTNGTRLKNIKVQLIRNGNIVRQGYTNTQGYYTFYTDSLGGYEIRIDTNYLPLVVNCPTNNVIYDTITSLGSEHGNKNFGAKCKGGFDIGVWSITAHGILQPGQSYSLRTNAGDIGQLYNNNCYLNQGGKVTLIYSGPAIYVGPDGGSLVPASVNGDTVIWNVPNFSSVNPQTNFNLIFSVDTTAQMGQQICYTVIVTPTLGDIDTSNNILTHCFKVFNSYDPNEKEVYPLSGIDTVPDWLTYTIHFQNTGNANAINIYVKDTLDEHVDENTFQLLSYSHQPLIQLNRKIIQFDFPNINLPDSTANEPNSHGYVQYRVKPKNGLPVGTQISNTANIYFDFNSPVVTNTVVNTVAIDTTRTIPNDTLVVDTNIIPNDTLVVDTNTIPNDTLAVDTNTVITDTLNTDTSVTTGLYSISDRNRFAVNVYPNPANTQITVTSNIAKSVIHIYSTEGKLLNTYAMQGTAQTINIETLACGIYYIEVTARGQTVRKKVVKL